MIRSFSAALALMLAVLLAAPGCSGRSALPGADALDPARGHRAVGTASLPMDQHGGDTPESLESYLLLAAQANPDLQAAFYRWQAAVEKAAQQGVLPDPRLSFGWYIKPIETRTGAQLWRIGLAQTFPWFGTLSLKEKVAWLEADALKHELDAKKFQLFLAVKKAFHEYVFLARATRIAEASLELTRFLESVSSTRYASGAGRHADLSMLQVELARKEERLRELRELREPLSARLRALIDRSEARVQPPLDWPEETPVLHAALDADDLLQKLVLRNPELRSAQARVDKESQAIDLARKGYFPEIMLSLERIETAESGYKTIRSVDPTTGIGRDMRTRTVEDSGNDPLIAGLSLNLPIWFGKTAAAVREAKANRHAALMRQAGLRNTLLTDLKVALYDYRDAERRIDLYRDTLIPKGRQNLGVTIEAFQTGLGSSVELIQAEQALLEFELAYVRAVTDQATALARVEMLVAEPLAEPLAQELLPLNQAGEGFALKNFKAPNTTP